MGNRFSRKRREAYINKYEKSSVNALTSMNEYLYSGHNDGKIIQWNAADGTKVREWTTGENLYALTSMNGYLYSGHNDGKIIQWDANGTKVREWNPNPNPNPNPKMGSRWH